LLDTMLRCNVSYLFNLNCWISTNTSYLVQCHMLILAHADTALDCVETAHAAWFLSAFQHVKHKNVTNH